MSHQLSREDREFVRAFTSGSLLPQQFDHRAHVRLAYAFLADAAPEAASAAMKQALLGFLEHHGLDTGKYHETLTRAWIMAVWHFMQRSGAADSADSFIAAHPVLLDTRVMLTHYSAEVLFSEDARRRFVQPDREAIPAHDA